MKKQKGESDEIIELRNKASNEYDRVISSKEYVDICKEEGKLYEKLSDIQTIINRLERSITKKYVDISHLSYGMRHRNFEITNIKSSVKLGIRRGLGSKYINLIPNDDIIKIVKEMIKQDLKGTDISISVNDEKDIRGKIDIFEKQKKILLKKYNEMNIELWNLRNNKFKTDKIREEKMKVYSEIVREKLPEYIDKIREEVNNCLIVDNLQD